MKKLWFVLLILIVQIFSGCSSGKELTMEEKSKLHPMLQNLIEDQDSPELQLQADLLEDGTKVYPVIIRTDNPEELKEQGIPTNSVSGDIVTARLTVEQIRKAAALSSVENIETGSTNYPK